MGEHMSDRKASVDDGGAPPAGKYDLDPGTMHAVRDLTLEQVEAYNRAAELVGRRDLSQVRPAILPSWLWDQMDETNNDMFTRLRDEGKIVRNELIAPSFDPRTGSLTAAGGWCAPSESLYSLPDIGVRRDGFKYPTTPTAPVPPPNRRQRLRAWRRATKERFSAARFAARKAWSNPDGWWEED